MICTSCGFDNPEGMNFCGQCSTPLSYLPTGVITYLFTDVEGSTQLWQQHSDLMSDVLTRHDALITAVVEEHAGMVVRSRGEGDSLFAVFVRARDAVAAACAVQQAILIEPWSSGLTIKVRMALHTGESELREHDYYGPVVNRCARLRGIAHGGQVVLSQATVELTQDALPDGVTFRDMGAHRLRGMERPEQVFQLLHPGLPSDFPALDSLDAQETPRHNLPVQLTSFIGRDDEIEEDAGLLSSARLVTLAGAGGSGKTRLSQEIGASVIEDYSDGVWFIGLAALSDPNMLRPLVAETFDVGEDALHGFLQERSILIILDNCEHVIVGAANLVQWLISSPGVSVIATSREALNLTGERMYQVPPLPVPADGAVQEILSDCPSVQLFRERATAAKPDFELTASNAGSVNQIVRRLDGIPLAIELAASRVKLMQPAEIANRLDDSFKILSGGPVDALPHHQTIERTIDWSYDMLDSEQQTLFRQVSVFRGGFTLNACGAVMGTEDEFEALDAIGELVDKSLVRTMPSGEETRYYLLEPLRQYAAVRTTADEATETGGRHAIFFRDLAESAIPEYHGPDQLEWFARLETEHDNFRAALTWGLEDGDADLGLRIAIALAWFWLIRRNTAEAVEWFERVLAMDGGSVSVRATALVQAGFIGSVVRHDNLAWCLERIREGMAQLTDLGDEQGVKIAQTYEAVILWFQRDLDASTNKFIEIQAAHRSYGFEWGDAFCDFFLGSAAWFAGDLEESAEHCSRALEIFRGIGDIEMIAWACLRLANTLLESGRLEESIALYEESLPMLADVGDRLGVGTAQLGIGLAAHFQGQTETANRLLGEAQTNLREGGGGQELSWAISNALVDRSTEDRLIEATIRYKQGINLPLEEWVEMVCADGEAWRDRDRSGD
jgi:predicted ATPase/class 3 adenylate cyclase